jgi:hypothetical protein
MKTFLVCLALAGFAFAAGPSALAGVWKATVTTPGGDVVNTFTFKADGGTLTGTVVSGTMPVQSLSAVKLEGDRISFLVIQKSADGTHEFKLTYTGEIRGREMALTLKFPAGLGKPVEMLAKKVE